MLFAINSADSNNPEEGQHRHQRFVSATDWAQRKQIYTWRSSITEEVTPVAAATVAMAWSISEWPVNSVRSALSLARSLTLRIETTRAHASIESPREGECGRCVVMTVSLFNDSSVRNLPESSKPRSQFSQFRESPFHDLVPSTSLFQLLFKEGN